MAWHFDGVNDSVTITDNAALDIPNAAFSVGGWVKLDDNSGTAASWIYGHYDWATQNSFNWYVFNSSAATADVLKAVFGGDTTADPDLISSTTPGSSTAWQYLLIVRSGSTGTMYVDGSSVHSTGTFDSSQSPTGSAYFGSRNDGDVDRFFEGDMAEWAKWDRALSAGEIAALAAGYSPAFFDPVWHIPMTREYVELRSGLVLTNNGTVAAAHPKIIYPSNNIIQRSSGPRVHSVSTDDIVDDDETPWVITGARFGVR